jgi:hypothetical protein
MTTRTTGLLEAFEHLTQFQAQTVLGLRAAKSLISITLVAALVEALRDDKIPSLLWTLWGVLVLLYGVTLFSWNTWRSANPFASERKLAHMMSIWCVCEGILVLVYSQVLWSATSGGYYFGYIEAGVGGGIRAITTWRLLQKAAATT